MQGRLEIFDEEPVAQGNCLNAGTACDRRGGAKAGMEIEPHESRDQLPGGIEEGEIAILQFHALHFRGKDGRRRFGEDWFVRRDTRCRGPGGGAGQGAGCRASGCNGGAEANRAGGMFSSAATRQAPLSEELCAQTTSGLTSDTWRITSRSEKSDQNCTRS